MDVKSEISNQIYIFHMPVFNLHEMKHVHYPERIAESSLKCDRVELIIHKILCYKHY